MVETTFWPAASSLESDDRGVGAVASACGGALMRFVRPLGLVLVLVLTLGVAWVVDVTSATAYSPSVTMIDNDSQTPNQAIEMGQAYWGYGPDILHVKKGEQVMFNNPATNKRPHSVTSISLGS